MNPSVEMVAVRMARSRRPVAAALTASGLYALAALGGGALAQAVEQAPVLKASQILPSPLMRGDDFSIQEDVANDGLMNTYTLASTFGTFQCVSTAELVKRIAEVGALRRMEAFKRSDLYAKAIGDSASGTVKAAGKLFTNPVATISGSVSGVSKAFARTGEAIAGSPRSDAENGAIESLLGVADAKRQLAFDLGVDAYSDNELLQARLNELARATTLGKLTTSAVLSAVPGGAGAVITMAGFAKTTNEIYRSTAPADLRAMNRKKLLSMGIREDIVESFIDNARFSPREQTEITFALERMQGVKGKDFFVYQAGRTADGDLAFFRERQAQMYAGYHARKEPLQSFVPFGEFVAARTAGGAVVFNLPVDHLVWTQWMADAVAAVDRAVSGMANVTGKQVHIAGTLSAQARQQLGAAGWTVVDNAESLIANP